MKLTLLIAGLLIQSFAQAATVNCRDTKTFAYGVASATDSPSGKTTISFSSSVLSLFANRLVPNSVTGYTTVTLEFPAADCQNLTDCSGSDIPVTVQGIDGQPAHVVVDTAVVNLTVTGLTAELVKGIMIRADASVPLNQCSSL